ncbi:hypothetical protein M514_07546 [Trichuris suis]|uniref:Uncharacterized protein n=1 Tax=Trichuris suis TaxID=68888 RepID=A0A085NEB7_9BILA|nr:hypothetical protein M513_07546 [Trichuris suis]KFD67813.1 hypothetical protein M514_07546 [Trichuris suis]
MSWRNMFDRDAFKLLNCCRYRTSFRRSSYRSENCRKVQRENDCGRVTAHSVCSLDKSAVPRSKAKMLTGTKGQKRQCVQLEKSVVGYLSSKEADRFLSLAKGRFV